MKLLFSNERSIKEITADFVRCFPFLRLKFFRPAALPGQTSIWEQELPGSVLVEDIKLRTKPALIEVDPSASVNSFERQVFEKTGLFAKVFRRQEQRWVEIRHAKDSIERLNAMGMASQSNSYNYHTLFL